MWQFPEMRGMRTLSVLVVLVVLAVAMLWPRLSGLMAAEGAGDGSRRGQRPPTAVTTWRIEPSVLSSTVVANGTLRAVDRIAIQPETTGRVVELNLRDAAVVKQGDLLVKLDDAPLRAELAAIEAERELAARTFRRQEDLVARNAVPQEAFDTARSRLNQLEAQIELIRARIDRTEIRAPFDGRLGLREVSLGAYVGPGDTLSTLQSEETLQLDLSVPERYQGRIAEGTEIILEVRGFSMPFSGTILARAPQVEIETRTVRFRAAVPNPGGKLLPGNFARVTIPLEEFPEALMIPAMAVLRDEASAYLFLAQDGKAVRRNVTLGIRTREEVQIIEGLQAGDAIIVRGGQNLADGGAVRVVDRPEGITNAE